MVNPGNNRSGFGTLPKSSTSTSLGDGHAEETFFQDGVLRIIKVPDDARQHSSSESESDSDDANAKRGAAKKAKKKKKKSKDVRAISKNGVLYVSDDNFVRSLRWVEDCHLLVSSSAAETAISKKPDITVDQMVANQSTKEAVAETEERVVMELSMTTLPFRLSIFNELLLGELDSMLGRHETQLNHDHVAPFRAIIPLEDAIRSRHKDLEAEFAIMAREHPQHFAVTRTADYLPPGLAYSVSRHHGEHGPKDHIDLIRVLLDGYRAMVHLLDTDLRGIVDSHRRIRAGTAQALPFQHLWYLFTPGQEVIVHHNKRHYQAYRVLQVTGGRRPLPGTTKKRSIADLVVDCFYLEYDGKIFDARPAVITIKHYDDVKLIVDLPVYPLSCHETSLATMLVERGRKFRELVHVSHRRYEGMTLREFPQFDTVTDIDSDVIVDFDLAFRENERLRPRFGGGVIDDPTEVNLSETNEPGWYYDNEELIRSRWMRWQQKTPLLRGYTPDDMTDEAYRLLPPRVYGYVLLSRKWYPLDIDLVQPVQTVQPGKKDGFEKLVLPPGHREIVRALVKTHARKVGADSNTKMSPAQREFDVVKGKGKGLIILLHGSPGVGKTSTAECVAANAGRPLFPITCGDLGAETAQEIETNLESFFDLARKWNCVLLLDEADVFLSTRLSGNIKQNSLVSVFLRVLEYYAGILILTTNRVGAFDEAIKSRVHCALYYPPLGEEQTFEIWRMNLASISERNEGLDPKHQVRFDQDEIEDFARQHWKSGRKDNRWNGRQIKNAFQTAVALAEWDHFKQMGGVDVPIGPLLKREHFNKVAKASRHFDRYLKDVRRSDYSRALAEELRDDDIGDELGSDDDDLGRKSEKKRGKGKKAAVSVKTTSKVTTTTKRKVKPEPVPEPEPSEESEDEESEESEESDESEEEEELSAPPTPPPEPAKKERRSGTKKSQEKAAGRRRVKD